MDDDCIYSGVSAQVDASIVVQDRLDGVVLSADLEEWFAPLKSTTHVAPRRLHLELPKS